MKGGLLGLEKPLVFDSIDFCNREDWRKCSGKECIDCCDAVVRLNSTFVSFLFKGEGGW